jgi:NADH dehydrogenase/NADH:ubiquinone oxidoreductase subunit G
MTKSSKTTPVGSLKISIEDYYALIAKFDKQISDPARGKKRKDIKEKYIEQEAKFIRVLEPLIARTPELNAEIDLLKKSKRAELSDLSKFTKEELRSKLFKAEIGAQISKQFVSNLTTVITHLLRESYNARNKRLGSVKNQKDAKDKKFKSNNSFLLDCLNQVTEIDKRSAKPNDFIKFRNLAIKTKPPYIQSTRRSKQDRMMSEEIQRLDAEALARNEWAPSTLRSFFEKHTGVKPSSVRK